MIRIFPGFIRLLCLFVVLVFFYNDKFVKLVFGEIVSCPSVIVVDVNWEESRKARDNA